MTPKLRIWPIVLPFLGMVGCVSNGTPNVRCHETGVRAFLANSGMARITVGCRSEYDAERETVNLVERTVTNGMPAIMATRSAAMSDELSQGAFLVPMCGWVGMINIYDSQSAPLLSVLLLADGETYLLNCVQGKTRIEALGQSSAAWDAFARIVFGNVPTSDVHALEQSNPTLDESVLSRIRASHSIAEATRSSVP